MGRASKDQLGRGVPNLRGWFSSLSLWQRKERVWSSRAGCWGVWWSKCMAVNAEGWSKDGSPEWAANINLWMQLKEGGPVQGHFARSKVDGETKEPSSAGVQKIELPQEARWEGDLHWERGNQITEGLAQGIVWIVAEGTRWWLNAKNAWHCYHKTQLLVVDIGEINTWPKRCRIWNKTPHSLRKIVCAPHPPSQRAN